MTYKSPKCSLKYKCIPVCMLFQKTFAFEPFFVCFSLYTYKMLELGSNLPVFLHRIFLHLGAFTSRRYSGRRRELTSIQPHFAGIGISHAIASANIVVWNACTVVLTSSILSCLKRIKSAKIKHRL